MKHANETMSILRARGFTIIELLIVIAIIIILAGLIMSTVGYVQKKGARSRAEAEIAAISAALESYKADNGIYPADAKTNALAPNTMGDPRVAAYQDASQYLYKQLSGDNNVDRIVNASDDTTGSGVIPKTYFAFKPNQLSPTNQAQNVTAIRDPFGNSYGYSTIKNSNPNGTDGYNPTFDLWSTAGEITATPNQNLWIKNW